MIICHTISISTEKTSQAYNGFLYSFVDNDSWRIFHVFVKMDIGKKIFFVFLLLKYVHTSMTVHV